MIPHQTTRNIIRRAASRFAPDWLLLYRRLKNLVERHNELEGRMSEKARTLERITHHLFDRPYENQESGASSAQGYRYNELSEKFRGPRQLTREILSPYLEYFATGPVVDLGCGRGEFLEQLVEKGIESIGIDSDEEMVHACKARHLDAIQSEMHEYLKSCDDGFAYGIFSAQVIEHIPFSDMVLLVREARRVLKANGVCILETVNPACIGAMRYFHLDPTHRAPIHPETLKYVFEAEGFSEATPLHLHSPPWGADPYFDSPVYAVLAKK